MEATTMATKKTALDHVADALARALCFVVGHRKSRIVEVLPCHDWLMECPRCGELYVLNRRLGIELPYDDELREFYDMMRGPEERDHGNRAR